MEEKLRNPCTFERQSAGLPYDVLWNKIKDVINGDIKFHFPLPFVPKRVIALLFEKTILHVFAL